MQRNGSSDDDTPATSDEGGGADDDFAQEIYLEFTVIGETVKVIAVDSETGTESSIVGSMHAPKAELERVAIAKLRYVMDQKASREPSSGVDRPIKNDGKGWVV